MNEFIFTIKELFTSVLNDNGALKYYIGPYQRGYKWDSTYYYDEVPQLLLDIYEAFEAGANEYFLQYITVLKNNVLHSLEVIDGQQRLTTLCILYYRLNSIKQDIENFTFNKLDYARYNQCNIFETLDELSVLNPSDCDTQDKFYIAKATQSIDQFIRILQDNKQLVDFVNYLNKNVKIILNRESEFVDAEEVFVNLNGNQVELTNAYLIKGLLLTLNVTRKDCNGYLIDYSKIVEQRRVQGRMWDEIQNWIEQSDVSHYFFGKSSINKGMESLLGIILKKHSKVTKTDSQGSNVVKSYKNLFIGNEPTASRNMFLYNKYHEQIKTEEDGHLWMNYLIHAYRKYRSIYENPTTFNLLGFIMFVSHSSRNNILSEILDLGESYLLSYLYKKALDLIPDNVNSIHYPQKSITNILLAINVFPEGETFEQKFRFTEYDKLDWSFEHIRPQNPPYSDIDIPEYCRSLILAKYKQDVTESPNEDIVFQIKNGKLSNIGDFPFLYADLDEYTLHSIGNMALLSKPINSSLNNSPFIVKRALLPIKNQEGYFIPPHTLSVFSKALDMSKCKQQFTIDCLSWSSEDVQAHAEWIQNRITAVKNYMKKEIKELEK